MSDLIVYRTTRPVPVEEKPSLVDGAGYKGIPWYENFIRWATEESTVPVPENPGYWNYSPTPTLPYEVGDTVPAPENPGYWNYSPTPTLPYEVGDTVPAPENPSYWNYSPMPTLTYGASGTVFDEALNRAETGDLQRHQPEPDQALSHLAHLVSTLLVTGATYNSPRPTPLPN